MHAVENSSFILFYVKTYTAVATSTISFLNLPQTPPKVQLNFLFFSLSICLILFFSSMKMHHNEPSGKLGLTLVGKTEVEQVEPKIFFIVRILANLYPLISLIIFLLKPMHAGICKALCMLTIKACEVSCFT